MRRRASLDRRHYHILRFILHPILKNVQTVNDNFLKKAAFLYRFFAASHTFSQLSQKAAASAFSLPSGRKHDMLFSTGGRRGPVHPNEGRRP